MRSIFILVGGCFICSTVLYADDYLGQLSANPYDPDSVSNPYGAGNPYDSDSINNPYGEYGNPYSNKSVTNPYATDAPKLYDSEGNYRGKLSSNPYDPESVSNPYGRYGSRYSPDSINNPYGAGNPYSPDSPSNPFGAGLGIFGSEDSDVSTEADSPIKSDTDLDSTLRLDPVNSWSESDDQERLPGQD